MSKSISDMTYKYINPETQSPTKVPPAHYEKILDQVTEKYMSDITSRQFLTIMYTQLSNLKKEDEKYFNQALLCMDLGLNPKDLRIDEQIAIASSNMGLSRQARDVGGWSIEKRTDGTQSTYPSSTCKPVHGRRVRRHPTRHKTAADYTSWQLR